MHYKVTVVTLLISFLILATLLAIISVAYSKWKKINNKFYRIKKKVYNSIPTIQHPQYKALQYHPLTNEPSKEIYNVEVAKLMINFIMSSYNLYADYDPALTKGVKLVTKVGTNGYLYTMNGDYVYAFRGTMTAKDLIADLIFNQTLFKAKSYNANDQVLVHSGFYDLWKTHNDDIIESLKQIPSGATVYVTGHSLGAALAAYSALEISNARNDSNNTILYVFAPPRCGNDRFIDEITRLVPHQWATINRRDVVCDLPPPVCPTFTKTYLYDDYRVTQVSDFETGEIAGNHHLTSYLDYLSGNNNGFVWSRK